MWRLRLLVVVLTIVAMLTIAATDEGTPFTTALFALIALGVVYDQLRHLRDGR